MPYTVFALKWRPQNFDEVIGQDHIATTLRNALQKNRIAHAYLFAGPRGVGKTSTARILAKALNCKEGPTVNPCGKCSSCLEISSGRSLDVMEIDGASNRQIDDIRTLRENVKFAPTQGKFKVYIIDEVHMLTPEAFNALLKTLEEPPPFVKFIFATTHPHKMPSTILSRCQRLDFRRIKAMEIVGQLAKIVKEEKIEVDKEVLFAIAKSSDGSLRDAESILDQLASFSKNKVSLKDVVSVLGLIEQDALFEITDRIIAKDAAAALEMFNDIIDEGKDISVFLGNLIEHFRNLMIAKITKADARLIDLPEETCAKLLQQSQLLTLEEIFSFFNIMVMTQEMGKRLETLRIPLEISIVKLANDKKGSAPAGPAARVIPAAVREKPVPAPESEPEPEPEPEPEAAPEPPAPKDTNFSVTLDDIKGIWDNVIAALGKIRMSVATYFNEGSPVKIEKGVLTVSFPKNYSLHKESLEKKENKASIEKVLREFLKGELRVNFILSQETSRADGIEDPFIKNALEKFNGRVIREG
ncbi:MAG: DNA polymerase III subunit gamma/tau [Candidatus Omnitrophota bacterium]